MRKMKRPKKTMTPSLDKRVQLVLELLVAADKRTDYIVTHVNELVKNQLAQDGVLDLIYDVLIEMRLPWYSKLWRWIRCRERNTS